MKKFSRFFSLILCAVLVAAMALTTVGCGKKAEESSAEFKEGATLGTGAVSFTLEVVDADGKSIKATIKTDAKTVGEALLDLGIIDGEDRKQPLSDDAISKQLKSLGIKCERRTVAKYRESLGIPGATKRRIK